MLGLIGIWNLKFGISLITQKPQNARLFPQTLIEK